MRVNVARSLVYPEARLGDCVARGNEASPTQQNDDTQKGKI